MELVSERKNFNHLCNFLNRRCFHRLRLGVSRWIQSAENPFYAITSRDTSRVSKRTQHVSLITGSGSTVSTCRNVLRYSNDKRKCRLCKSHDLRLPFLRERNTVRRWVKLKQFVVLLISIIWISCLFRRAQRATLFAIKRSWIFRYAEYKLLRQLLDLKRPRSIKDNHGLAYLRSLVPAR